MAKSPWKYIGGKSNMLTTLREFVPTEYGTYYEPMVGSGALFYDLEPASAWIGDTQPNVAEAHSVIQKQVDALVKELLALQKWSDSLPLTKTVKASGSKKTKSERHAKIRKSEIVSQEDLYYWMRNRWNDDTARRRQSSARRVASFIYLARTCFNGIWRKNKLGKVNSPFGKRDGGKGSLVLDELVLRRANEVLQRASVHLGDLAVVTDLVERDDFVYFDPPYEGTYARYTEHGFTLMDQCRVAEAAKECARRGAHVMVTNSNTDLVERIYQEGGGRELFDLYEVNGARSVSCKSDQRTAAKDILILTRRTVS